MFYPHPIEDLCYTEDHIEKVMTEIRTQFPFYFEKFIQTENGNELDVDTIQKLANKFGNPHKPKKKKDNIRERYSRIIDEANLSFEQDRKKYLDILDLDAISEFEDDPAYFKNTILRNQCPIIHHTLQNTLAKELDKYRAEFKHAQPGDLLKVVKNLTVFAINYKTNVYNTESFENINKYSDLNFSDLQGEEYTAFGVIGGGIKSHLLYKLFPFIFPNRSRESVWALWYLTSKKAFGCVEDSEFLMIDLKNNSIQQNYFYPYDLFSFYALNIYRMLNEEALKESLFMDSQHRFIIVDAFLSYIFKIHEEEINFLRSKLPEDSYEY